MKSLHRVRYPKDVDRLMVKVLNALNSVPGIRTLFSCEGHGESEFYVSMAVCSPQAAEAVKGVSSRSIPDLETVEEDGCESAGTLPYETYLGIYSWKVGTLPYAKRRRFLATFAQAVERLVPENHWGTALENLTADAESV